MKKFFAAAAIALFMMTSCSDDDSSSNNNNNTDVVLVKKTIETYEDGSTLTSTFHYNGTKVSKIQHSDDSEVKFTYLGDNVSKAEYFENGEMIQRTAFAYDSQGRVISMIEYIFDEDMWADKTTYTYNSNGTISIKLYSGDHTSQSDLYDEGTIHVVNGNVVSEVTESVNMNYTFDSKNNPEKNITGIDNMNIAWGYGGKNNVTGYTYGDNQTGLTATYTYNADNYPVTSVEVREEETVGIQYFYE